MAVIGPIKLKAYVEGTTCDVCGTPIRPGEDMLVLRVDGRHMRVCGDACADRLVKLSSAEPREKLA